jgi:hypothetical protein
MRRPPERQGSSSTSTSRCSRDRAVVRAGLRMGTLAGQLGNNYAVVLLGGQYAQSVSPSMWA